MSLFHFTIFTVPSQIVQELSRLSNTLIRGQRNEFHLLFTGHTTDGLTDLLHRQSFVIPIDQDGRSIEQQLGQCLEPHTAEVVHRESMKPETLDPRWVRKMSGSSNSKSQHTRMTRTETRVDCPVLEPCSSLVRILSLLRIPNSWSWQRRHRHLWMLVDIHRASQYYTRSSRDLCRSNPRINVQALFSVSDALFLPDSLWKRDSLLDHA